MVKAADTLRQRNMRARRERVLAEARHLLASGGFEALSLRELARRAEVTVPTIYNLVGPKENVLLALGVGVLEEVEARSTPAADAAPLELATAVLNESLRLFAENPDFYRAAFLAVEWLDQGGQHHDEVARIYAWVERLLGGDIENCRRAGFLRGRIPLERLSAAATRNFRMCCRGWAFGHYDLDAFRRIAVTDLYISLAADAVESFQSLLLRAIADAPAPTRAFVTRQAARSVAGKRGEPA